MNSPLNYIKIFIYNLHNIPKHKFYFKVTKIILHYDTLIDRLGCMVIESLLIVKGLKLSKYLLLFKLDPLQ